MLHMTGKDAVAAVTDYSVGKKSFTFNGNAQIDTAQGKFNGDSLLLDGTGDYVSTPHHADFDFGTGNFTIDFQARINTLPTGTNYYEVSGTDHTSGFLIQYQNNSGSPRIRFWLAGNLYDFSWSASINTWYHIAITRNGTDLRMFIDGVQIGTTQTSSDNIGGTTAFLIGDYLAASTPFNGWIDEFRIQKGEAYWTANFTPPASPYTSDDYGANFLTGGTASASSVLDGSHTASNAFDGVLTSPNYWGASTASNEWLKYDLGSGKAQVLGKYRIWYQATATYMPKSWTLQGSNNDSNWTDLMAEVNQTIADANAQWIEFIVNNTTAYRYYRLNAIANDGGGFVAVHEWQAFAPNIPAKFLELNQSVKRASLF